MCTALIMSMERDIPAENITVGNISVRINKSGIYFFGNTTIKQLPQPFTLSTEIFPPCASTMAFTMVRPIPAPPVLRLRERSVR